MSSVRMSEGKINGTVEVHHVLLKSALKRAHACTERDVYSNTGVTSTPLDSVDLARLLHFGMTPRCTANYFVEPVWSTIPSNSVYHNYTEKYSKYATKCTKSVGPGKPRLHHLYG